MIFYDLLREITNRCPLCQGKDKIRRLSICHFTALRAMLGAFIASLPARVFRSTQRRIAARHPVNMSVSAIPLSDSIDVHVVPILSDNFSYLIHDKANSSAALVDPAEPRKLLDVANSLSASVTSSLTTHHHWDHAGGNNELAQLVPGVEIVGSAYEGADGVTLPLETGTLHNVKGTSLIVSVLRTPCHTQGHLCFSTDTPQKAVFTGDTLFIAGCGKFFEGTAQDMQTSLNTALGGLDDDTLVFCGHEYTVTNLLFAQSVDPQNEVLQKKLIWAQERVEIGEPTVPSKIGDEKLFNPFMRTTVTEIAQAVNCDPSNPVEVMKALRERKNSFRR